MFFSPGLLLGLLTAVNLILTVEANILSSYPGQQSQWYPGTSKSDSCERNCSLPACFCGRGIPGGLSQHQTPQFVVLSFDDAVNDLNREFYERLFKKYETSYTVDTVLILMTRARKLYQAIEMIMTIIKLLEKLRQIE